MTAEEKKEDQFLLDRIGGEAALEAAVDEFYLRVISDNTLGHFFDGITIESLKEHQRKFLRIALTKIPESFDVEQFMFSKHRKLFLIGLNESHFDTVAGHFVGTLEMLQVSKPLIDEAVGIIAPLRGVFAKGADQATSEEKKEEETKEQFLLDHIGGDAALGAAVDEFYKRVIADETLQIFFEGFPMDQLKEHQHKFMRMAFTKIPESIDVEKFMMKKHERLFLMGLGAEHFDSVAGHFVGTLQSLGVEQSLIDEAVDVIAPLRSVFETGAEETSSRVEQENYDNEKEKFLLHRLGGEDALTAAVNEFYVRVVADKTLARFFEGIPLDVLKDHQHKFMRMAFTEVPKDTDVDKMMFAKHYRLFHMGLNETHFDTVAGHFVGTLEHLGVSKDLVDEAVSVIAPLRGVFEKGSRRRSVTSTT